MQFTLTPPMVLFLDRVLNNPQALGLQQYGVQAYAASGDNEGKMLARLKTKWFRGHVMPPTTETADKPYLQQRFELPEKDVPTGLDQAHLDMLKTVADHYKKVGHTAEWCDIYVSLLAVLKGEKPDDADPFEAPTAAKPELKLVDKPEAAQ
jgi:hypothetical protein